MIVPWINIYNNNINIQKVLVHDIKLLKTYKTSMYSLHLIHLVAYITEHVMVVSNTEETFIHIFCDLYEECRNSTTVQHTLLQYRNFLYINNILYKKNTYICLISIKQCVFIILQLIFSIKSRI